jgi:hypothetical protein
MIHIYNTFDQLEGGMTMPRKRTEKEAEASASTFIPKRRISLKKSLELEFKTEAAGSEGTNQVDLSSVVSKREKIALLAYTYWMQRGCQGGSPEEDWFRAERELDTQPSARLLEKESRAPRKARSGKLSAEESQFHTMPFMDNSKYQRSKDIPKRSQK